MAETSPPSQPTKTSHNTAGKASAAGTKRRSFDKNETLEDFTVSTDMGQFYSDDESSADDEDVVVRTLGQQPRVLRKQNFLYSDSSDTDDDVQETRHGGVVPPDVKAYVAVSPRAMTPPAPTQASAAAEKKSIQPSSTHDHGRSNQGDAKEDKMSDDEGVRTTATGHVFCKEEVVDGPAANQEQCKQASDSDEPTTQQVQLSPRRTRRRPPVVEDSDDDIVPSARKGDSSDSDEVSMTKQTNAASSRRPVVARPGFADSDDSDDGLTADSKRTVLAQTHSTHAEKAQDEESLEDFVPAATRSDSEAGPASPRESLASRPVLQVAPIPSSKAAADGLSDDDVFLDVILDESDVDSNPPAHAPPVAPSASPLPDSSDSRPDVVAPPPPVVQRPSISTREIPTTPVESTLPPAMPSLMVVNVMSTQPVDNPTSINHPARHAAGGRAKKRGVKARLDLLDSGSEHSSSPTGRKATQASAAKPPAIAASDGERSSGDQEFVVAKSSSFWSDDDDDDDDKFVTSSSTQRGRNSSPPLAPVKPAIAPTPPASATQMNASVLAAIEEAKRAAIEMLQTTATSTPMPAALLVSTATDVNKPKADKTRKKTLSKRSTAKSAARMHVVASDEDS
ncbi:hypothetical protein H310_08330 [Aphanomyces invadans]|uniref:Uncharacterized protein n=1 Tax=Aphanomyces invadans TaxID=157072 RepID=A0A024TYX7_9STRA|nr:hypothetical protein H310_08330 [Aphanomyces invadans]ETV98826.1 hypothetical protein H310_08330 [Aphanomyces invadans]|eukprot:XP_008872254.1 hypothetical protein H310_08330 [Aphanomyces invadans]